METKKVLIVGEHQYHIELLRNILRARGLDTIEDHAGFDCLFLAKIHQPKLIIMHSLLQYSSGACLAMHLREHYHTKNIAIMGIVLNSILESEAMIRAGCFDCVETGFTLDILLKMVNYAINGQSQENYSAKISARSATIIQKGSSLYLH